MTLKTAPNFVLGSQNSSTYPGGYACGFCSPAASLDDRFERHVWMDVLHRETSRLGGSGVGRVRLTRRSRPAPCGLAEGLFEHQVGQTWIGVLSITSVKISSGSGLF
jgi:hypothetical protein